MSLTLSDTALNDNQVIWLVKIDADTTIKLASKDITLSSNVWDGQVVLDDSLSDGGKAIDISYGGGIGSVGSFELSIARYNFNALTDGFHTEFYPDNGGVYLTSRVVHIGFLWEGATTEAEITWFFYGYIDEYSYDADKITLTCLEYAELENIELPYYRVQKDFNNEISYTTETDDNGYGLPIPIIYGDFTVTDFHLGEQRLAPTVLMNKANIKCKVSSHQCYYTVKGNYTTPADQYILFKSVGGGYAYLHIYSVDGAEVNNITGHSITILNTSQIVRGYIRIPLKGLGANSDIDNIANIVDNDIDSYEELTSDGSQDYRVCLRINASISDSDIGYLSSSSTGDINVSWYLSSPGGASRAIRMYYRNNDNTGDEIGLESTGTVNSATITAYQGSGFAQWTTTGKSNTNLPYTMNELTSYEYCLENEDADVGDKIYVHNAVLILYNIIVAGQVQVKFNGFRVRR